MVPRWVLVVLAVGAAVTAVDVGVFVVSRSGTTPAEAQPGDSVDLVGVIDPKTSRVLGRVHVGKSPTTIVAGYGAAWVLNRGEETLTQIDARTHRVVGTLPLDVTATDLALGAGGIWFAGRPSADVEHAPERVKLERIDPATDRVDRAFRTQTGALALAAGGNSLWSWGVLPGNIRGAARADAATGAMHRVDIQIYGDLVAADERSAYWVGSGRIARASTRTGVVTTSLKLASNASLAAGLVLPNATDVALGGGALWISAIDGSVLRVDTRLRGILASIRVCRNALALAYGEGAVWVACGNGTVVRVDPKTDKAGLPIHVGALPRGIAAGDGAVWVTLN